MSGPGCSGLIPAHAGKTPDHGPRSRFHQAHPRSRGENPAILSPRAAVAGSSPLTRGKPRVQWCERLSTGLIPAHAGKTDKCLNGIQSGSAHPRSRGENQPRQASGRPVLGSSPLTRGKRPARIEALSRRGLIPAHAGKTGAAWLACAACAAHPRSRGENSWRSRYQVSRSGSSPLTRGKHVPLKYGQETTRLIPAHAGKTPWRRGRSPLRRAHPRSRGENAARWSHRRTCAGSSPLTRGKPSTPTVMWYTDRLIPAHAGKTLTRSGRSAPWAAHPRSRGENAPGETYEGTVTGSSPLTRGKPLAPIRPNEFTQAHPRSRGENTTKKRSTPIKTGSSPLTRGKRVDEQAGDVCPGLIPAHAGKTLEG